MEENAPGAHRQMKDFGRLGGSCGCRWRGTGQVGTADLGDEKEVVTILRWHVFLCLLCITKKPYSVALETFLFGL